MKTNTRKALAAFTLIELLTVIAIIGILASIIIPTVGNVQEKARRTTDLSNMKQVIQSAMLFANENNERFPALAIKNLDDSAGTTTTTAFLWAGAISKYTGLNDPSFYISKSDGEFSGTIPLTILNEDKTALSTNGTGGGFAALTELSIQMIAGLKQGDAATTPLTFTRGLNDTTGKWDATGTYKTDGGYIGYVGGNVAWYKDVTGDDGNGVLLNTRGQATKDIKTTIKATAKILGTTSATIKDALGTGQ